MNRELKFRVWDTKYKKFGYNGYSSDLIIWMETNVFSLDNSDTKTGDLDRYIFQQYTGLKDKNRKEIYEGDIIIFMGRWDEQGNVLQPDYQKYTVNWFMGGFWAMTTKKSCRSFHIHNEMLGVGHTNNEIIGNVYENPELMK